MSPIRTALTATLLTLLISCGEEFSPLLETGEESFFFSLEDGALVAPEEEVRVSYADRESEADKVTIRLKDGAGEEVAVVTADPEDLQGDGLPIAFPEDLEEGIYRFAFEAWGKDSLLSQSEVSFFIVRGSYRIRGIETYPSDIRAGEHITAGVSLSYPQGRNPWLRWTLDDQVIKEGFLSEIRETCFLAVPGEEGVFALQAELFPLEPEPSQKSSVRSHTNLFVVSGEGPASSSLKGNRSTFYASFLSDDQDVTRSAGKVETIGNPHSEGIGRGFRFAADEGIRYGYGILPTDEERRLQSFTLSLNFEYDDLPDEGEWGMIRVGRDFLLLYDGERQAFRASLAGKEGEPALLDRKLLPEKGLVSLDLVYAAGDDGEGGRFSWFSRGKLLQHAFLKASRPFAEGRTLIGSDGTGPGLPLEWLSIGVSGLPREAAPTALPEQAESEAEGAAAEQLYRRGRFSPDKLSLQLPLGEEGIYSLEILTDGPVPPEAWEFSLRDGEDEFYSGSLPLSEESQGLTLSLVNRYEGVFFSDDGGVRGPFSSKGSLQFRIVPYNSDQFGLDAIKEIRLYRD